MKTILKLTFFLLAILLQATAHAHDFKVGRFKYTITSDTTVEVTKYEFTTDEWTYLYGLLDIHIPDHVSFNNINYTVTAIGDSAFYTHSIENVWDSDEFIKINVSYNIYIPETVASIGHKAFGGELWYGLDTIHDTGIELINIICAAKTPPIMNNCFNGSGDINLFVSAEAYTLYEEFNHNNHYFTSIYVTDGERSNPPEYIEDYLYQPVDNWQPFGCAVKILPCDNNIVFIREVHNYTGLWNHFYADSWTKCNNHDSIYFYYEAECDGGALPDGWELQFFAIEKGKNPSSIISCGNLSIGQKLGFNSYRGEPFNFRWSESFDFMDSNISYNILENSIEVTSCCYRHCVVDEGEVFIPYSGDIIIPNVATYHNYYNDTYTTYLVTNIGNGAFTDYDCWYNSYSIDNLTSITMPTSIQTIGRQAIGDCPNLAYIKCLGVVPANASENSFDEGVLQNTTLYVPMGAVEAYKAAEGWKEFWHIVGFYDYDFVVDGVYYKISGDNQVMVSRSEEPYHGVIYVPTNVTYDGVTYDVTGIIDGVFAGTTLQSLILPVTISTIGNAAFDNCHINSLVINGNGVWTAGPLGCDVDNLYVMSGITGIEGLMVNPVTTVYSYSTVPPTCSQETFTGYDAELHVPASALAAYFTAPYWNYFINITSDAIEPTGLSLNRDSVEILVGNQLALTVIPAPNNATPPDAVIWMSSDESIATVTDGIITAVHVGECDIKAYLLDKIAVCHVTVTEIAPTEITLSQEFAKLEIGSLLTLTATVTPDDATDKTVTWSTSNAAVATVDDQGNVMAVGQGECFITATCRDMQATCHVIVVDHFVFITLDEHELRLLPNHMAILTPSVLPEGTALVVASSDPDVAAARMANGRIQVVGIKEGTTVIKVNSTDGYAETDSCLVKVYTERGDVNCDGFVNISDVTALINYLLNHNAEGIDEVNADTNNDATINISDVTRLISHLLSGDELDPKEEPGEEEDTLAFIVNGVTFTMVAVEGGTFTMGATAEQGDDALDGEKPAHQVTLSSYAIGQTEVTQALWEAVMGTNPSRFQGRPDNPVELVTWNDCQEFIAQLNALTGKQFRLPTEAEWEFAARGGNLSQGYKYAGSNDVDEVAWYSANSSSTQPVGTKQPNELGIYDMGGNVWEWCQDYYDSYGSEPQTNPTGPETGTDRIRRGGGWNGGSSADRVSHRSSRAQTYSYNSLGLRLAL